MKTAAATSATAPWLTIAAAVFFAFAASSPVMAQESDLPRINYLFAVNYGFGDYDIEGRSVQVHRVPIGFTLRSLEDKPWGLRLTLPLSFGVHDLKASSDLEDLAARFETMSITPGLEAHVPVGSHWLLKPFAEAGWGTLFSGGGSELIYAFGMRSRGDYPLERSMFTVGAAVRYDATTAEYANNSSFSTFELGTELTYPLGFSISDRAVDMSTFVIFRRFADLFFESVEGEQLSVDKQWEIGVTFGSQPRPTIWGIKMPRIGIGYRWAGHLQGVRINFGFPF